MSIGLSILTLILFFSPIGQSALNSWVKNKLINDFDVDLSINSFFMNPVGMSSFEDLLIKDHKNDTLIFVNHLEIESRHFGGLINNDIYLGEVTIDSFLLNHVTYRDENLSNFDVFLEKFNFSKGAKFSASQVKLNESKLQFLDKNDIDSTYQIISNLNANLVDISSKSADFSAVIEDMTLFVEDYGLDVIRSNASFSIASGAAKLEELNVITPNSQLIADLSLRLPTGGSQDSFNDILIDASVQESSIGLEDIRSFVPNISGSDSFVIDQLTFSGTPNKFSLDSLRLSLPDSNFSGSLSFNNSEKTSNLVIDELIINPEDILAFVPSLAQSQVDFLKHLGTSKMTGELTRRFSNHKINMAVYTSFGLLDVAVDFLKKDTQTPSFYDGKIHGNQYDMGGLLKQNTLGISDFSFDIKGKGLQLNQLDTELNGYFSSFSYQDIKVDTISVNLDAKYGQIIGSVDINDSEAKIQVEGEFNVNDSLQKLSAFAEVNQLKLKSFFPSTFKKERDFSGNFEIVSLGEQINDFIGDIKANAVQINIDDQRYTFEDFTIQSRVNKDLRFFNFQSVDFINGLIYGKFELLDIEKMFRNSFGSYFSNYQSIEVDQSSFMNFNINLKEKFSGAFLEQIIIPDDSFFRGKLSADPNDTFFQMDIPKIRFKNNNFSEVRFTMDNGNPFYKTNLQIGQVNGEDFDLDRFWLINSVFDDKLYFRAEFENNSLDSELNFFATLNEKQELEFGIQPSTIAFQSKQWKINHLDNRTSTVLLTKMGFEIGSTVFSNNESALHFSFYQQDSQRLNILFENINLSDFILPKPKRNISGITNGTLDITVDNDQFGGEADVKIDSLIFNNVMLGDALISLNSIQDQEAYQLSFNTTDDGSMTSSVEGLISSENENNLNLNATFQSFPAAILDQLIGNAMTDVEGLIDGSVSIDGKWNQPILQGELFLDGFQFYVPYLNVGYGLVDGSSIKVSPTSFAFEPTTLIDSLNSTSASFKGSILHQNFKFFNLDMNFTSPNLFILDTDDSYDNKYYGKAFFNGNARIHGPSQSLTFDLDGSSAEGTNIVIAVDNSGSIEDVSYLKFVDKNATKNADNQTSSPSLIKGLTLNFDLSITQDAELELLFDSDTGSTLRGSGVGSILMEINTDGNFNVFGDFIALNGIYQFKNFSILEKEFRLEPGGTILWNGNPLDAQLNLQAIYEVPGGANPAILLENPGLNRKIPTDVKINLTGSIMQLEAPSFTIDFPNTSANVRNDLAYKLDDEERRQIQAISLLSQGVFISDLSLSAITAQALTNNLFQKASGVFESIFSGDEEKLKLGLNYLQGDRNSESIARTRDRLGLTLVTKVSDRLLINGKLGVPFGGVEETIIVGDVTIEFLLSKDGALRARIFNRENEFQYFGDELGYTQGVGLSYQVEFDDFKSLIKKIVKKNAI